MLSEEKGTFQVEAKLNQKTMKNNLFFTALLALTFTFLVIGCKKDETANSTVENCPQRAPISNELEQLYKQVPPVDLGNIRLINGDILRFESAEHYIQVYDELLDLCEVWTTLFLQIYDTGDEEELDATIERLGFDDLLPLYKFEQKYKSPIINTSLECYAFKEEEWLNRGGDPPSNDITECPVGLAILSLFHEYCIKDTIFQFRPDGYQILIPISELSCLTALRNTSITELLGRAPVPNDPYHPNWIVLTNPPVTVIPPDVECKSNFKNSGTVNHGDDYRFNWFYHYYSFFTSTAYSMKNYKLKNGKWKKDYSSFGQVSIGTQLYWDCGEDCCNKDDMIKYTGNNLKTFWRGDVVFRPWDWTTRNRCNPDESYIICRHKGTNFKINVLTGNLID
ncbi:MAG: hypothetical protein FWH59_01200 [Lentimicrobiaceae bacterium]|nr:hypothetical protein [Lentimicrobiaceae bacterium]